MSVDIEIAQYIAIYRLLPFTITPIYSFWHAQELFLEEIASRAGKTMLADNRRLLAYKDVGVWS